MNACHIYPSQRMNIDKRLLFRFSIFCTKMNIFSFSSAFALFCLNTQIYIKKAPHFTMKSFKRIKMNLLLNGCKVTYIFIANIHKKRSVFTNRAFKLFPNKEKYEVITYKQLICFHFSKVQKLIEFICVLGFFGEIITFTALTPYLMKRNRFGSL